MEAYFCFLKFFIENRICCIFKSVLCLIRCKCSTVSWIKSIVFLASEEKRVKANVRLTCLWNALDCREAHCLSRTAFQINIWIYRFLKHWTPAKHSCRWQCQQTSQSRPCRIESHWIVARCFQLRPWTVIVLGSMTLTKSLGFPRFAPSLTGNWIGR